MEPNSSTLNLLYVFIYLFIYLFTYLYVCLYMIFPLYKTSIYEGFSMAMLNNQMVLLFAGVITQLVWAIAGGLRKTRQTLQSISATWSRQWDTKSESYWDTLW